MSPNHLLGSDGKCADPRGRTKLTYIAVIAMALTGAATAPGWADCSDMFEVKIQEWPGDIINIVPWVAEDAGIFQKHCVDVEFVPVGSGPGAYAAMVSGDIHFANGAPDGIMRSRAQGVDFRLIGNMYAAQWSTLVGRIGLDLPHAAEGYPAIMNDLVGKRIGVTVLGGSTEAYVRSAFEGAGLDGDSATFVAVGGVATAVPALSNALVDAAMMFGTGPDLAVALGAGEIILDLRQPGVGPEEVQALWGATLSWAGHGPFIDENPDTIAAFVAANDEAIGWIQDPENSQQVYAIINKYMPLPSDLTDPDATLRRIVDINAAGLSVGIPEETIDGWNSYLVFLEQIEHPIPYEELVWPTGRE